MFWPTLARRTWDPWMEMESLHRQMERVFSDAAGKARTAELPAMNLWVNENEAIVAAEVPGITTDDLEVSVKDDVLTIRGQSRVVQPSESALAYGEFEPAAYERRFTLGNQIDRDKVSAKLKDGVLTLILPKHEETQARKIQIKAG